MTKLSRPTAAAADHRDLPAQFQHSFHQGHSLKLIPNNDGVRFKCDGCKLPGVGARYECERGPKACNLDLHISCALAPALREIGGHWFVFLQEPLPDDRPGRTTFCDACGRDATGFVYHCPDLEHDLHPICAGLPDTFDLAGLLFELRMKDDAPQRRRCALCTKKTTYKWGGRRCWSYCSVGRGDDDDVFLHVACAMDLSGDSFTKVNECSWARRAPLRLGLGASSPTPPAASTAASDQEMVKVNASALRELLLKGQGRISHWGRGGALERSLRVLGFIVRVIIGVIFGDPTAMILALGQALSGG